MKRISVFFFLLLFVTSTLAVSVQAACLQGTGTAQLHEMTENSSSMSEPCHGISEKKSEDKGCCDTLCLCLHAAKTQTVIPVASASLTYPAVSEFFWPLTHEEADSLSLEPPYKPPKFIS